MANSRLIMIIVKEHANRKNIAISKELQTQLRRDRAPELTVKSFTQTEIATRIGYTSANYYQL
jgi:hypothetical protein